MFKVGKPSDILLVRKRGRCNYIEDYARWQGYVSP